MFRQRTTFVIGAGASCELDLPSGDTLKSDIVSLLRESDQNAYGFSAEPIIAMARARTNPIRSIPEQLHALTSAAQRIRRGLPLALSIDNFLHTHQDDPVVIELGKAAIAICISAAERQSKMFYKNPVITANSVKRSQRMATDEVFTKTWYVPFVQLLFSQVERGNIASAFRGLQFIIFNYDRCFEEYLFLAIQAYFDVSAQDAAAVLASVVFIHPYGSLGPLPWQTEDATQSVRLGNSDGLDFWAVGQRLRTFTESCASDIESRIKASISTADTIILLGFGYLDQNVRLLMPEGTRTASRVISTAHGVSPQDQDIMRQTMRGFGEGAVPNVMLELGTCRELFDHFRLQLSLA